ncbi:hypothetical protein, conserved [Trypanosoma brucei gambiense DAL972]|uniref:Uncharacterized protein n=1 Tax=Trypanosoma brucei gambiense (strain MHOM/CI/86/DAL972) TaxID=679716 RepID=C9ZMS3_TRYB9|nr:hypothetical protein, conserved [Trypanosoma brucei gambiense DAL972]CBH10576.1 hypothetical protein, conserved [Trypanosoma brucei gambiense DAL972]|eukprot:XP_011772865.1 hypothetical protein, conserved [Trypanosoma brucei gambiense DAL972]
MIHRSLRSSYFSIHVTKPQRVLLMGYRQCASSAAAPLINAKGAGVSPQKDEVRSTCQELRRVMASLLEDRQCLYRDAVLSAALDPYRSKLQSLLEGNNFFGGSTETPKSLTLGKLLECRDGWAAQVGGDAISLVDFYNAFLLSALVNSHADVQLVLDCMQQHDHMDPTAETYVAIMHSFTAQRKGPNPVAGDTAFHYFGHALKTRGEGFITPELWSAVFVVCAVTGAAGKLLDQWWELLLKTCKEGSSPLPYGAVHAALTWCSSKGDVERVMRYFNAANSNSMVAFDQNDVPHVIGSGSLTTRSSDQVVQQCQLRLLVKLMVTAKAIELDGGLRALVVKDVRRLIDPEVLRAAPWGIINDLLSGLSLQSAMQLLKFRSAAALEKDGAVPFTLWASLLRRCARDHHIDQAESLFLFIRKRFELSGEQKAELVEIMIRMFATLPQGDFASATSLFIEHVIRHPPGEPRVEPNATFYNLLIRATDTRNAAMMTFLEACAAGIDMNIETFEALCRSNRFGTISSLSKKLPHGYQASKLDQQIRIPADADAHLRREEAMRLRGKPLVDSTGEVD